MSDLVKIFSSILSSYVEEIYWRSSGIPDHKIDDVAKDLANWLTNRESTNTVSATMSEEAKKGLMLILAIVRDGAFSSVISPTDRRYLKGVLDWCDAQTLTWVRDLEVTLTTGSKDER